MLDAAAFQTYGQDIARTFCAGETIGGSDLCSLLEKFARDQNLNPEQITRLTEATNRAVFSVKYAASKGTPDRRAQFQPVDPASVINRLVKTASTSANQPKSPMRDAYPDLKTLRGASREKVAHVPFQATTPEAPIAPALAYDMLCRVREDLQNQQKLAEYRWQETLRDLDTRLRRTATNRETFEKNAVALYGGRIHDELNALREAAQLPPLPAGANKYASIQECLVGQRDHLSDLLGKAGEYRAQYDKAYGMLLETNESFDALRKELFGE